MEIEEEQTITIKLNQEEAGKLFRFINRYVGHPHCKKDDVTFTADELAGMIACYLPEHIKYPEEYNMEEEITNER